MKEKMVCIEWEDASYNSGYFDKEKPQDFVPVRTKSVGHLIKSSRTSVIISAERFYDSKGKISDDRHIDTIPRKMIKKITYLRGE